MTSKTIRAAVVQAAPISFKCDLTLVKVSQLCKEASSNGSQLVVFPEAFISCYPRGSNFGAVIGNRTYEGRDLYKLYWESSITIPGPAVDQLSEICKENKIHLVIGVIEKDGGTLYCTIIFFSDDGQYLGKHRKLMPTASERLIWGFGDGSSISVFDTSIGKIGGAICWENYMPMLRMALYSKGIQIYCAPTADGRDSWISTMRHIALEGRCFVLSCNQFARRCDYPKSFFTEFDSNDEQFVVSRGGSCIISPLGEIMAGPNYDSEIILYADLDLNDIIRGKFDFDVVGHYSRPDVFTLYVNENPMNAVCSRDSKDKPGSS